MIGQDTTADYSTFYFSKEVGVAQNNGARSAGSQRVQRSSVILLEAARCLSFNLCHPAFTSHQQEISRLQSK